MKERPLLTTRETPPPSTQSLRGVQTASDNPPCLLFDMQE